MNKFFKVILSILGGINSTFSLIIPIFISLLIVGTVELSPINQQVVLWAGWLSSLYRGINMWL